MKILVINYRYFLSGGPERYMFNLEALLEAHGHTVIPFSITYDRNEPSEYAQFFAPPLSGTADVYFKDHSHGVKSSATALTRTFYSPVVYQRLRSLITATRPDAALVLHYLRKLSPSVLKCLADHRVPFAVRVSDFAMVCPSAHLFRDGEPCELCVTGGLRHSVRYRCVHASAGASAANWLATRFHQAAGFYRLIPTFIVPTQFTLAKMEQGGWDHARLAHIPTFVPTDSHQPAPDPTDPPSIAYVGRLEHLKGVHVLLDAVRLLKLTHVDSGPFTVRIVGTGDATYVESLRSFVAQNGLANVRFEGVKTGAALADVLRRARCSVVPSLWYENMPNVALESMAQGIPVVAPNAGCFPEIVEHDLTGLLVPPNDASALAGALRRVLGDADFARVMGRRAFAFVQNHHSPDTHYSSLMATLNRLRANSTTAIVEAA